MMTQCRQYNTLPTALKTANDAHDEDDDDAGKMPAIDDYTSQILGLPHTRTCCVKTAVLKGTLC